MPGGIQTHRRRLNRALAGVLLTALAWCFAAPAFAALGVSMSIAPTYANPIFPGDVTAFRITLTNSNALATVTSTAFTDNLPAGLQVAGGGAVAYNCVAGNGTTTAGVGTVTAVVGTTSISLSGGVIPLAVGGGASGRCDIDVEVTSLAGGTSPVNTIAVGAVTGNDGAAVQNATQAQQSITTNTLNLPTITKTFSAASVVRNDQVVTLTLKIDNAANATKNLPLNGAGDTPAFALRDILPVGLQVAAIPNAVTQCGIAFAPAAGATTLLATGGVVPAAGSCTISVDVVGTTTAGGYSNGVTNTVHAATDVGNKRGLVPGADASASLAITSALRVQKVFTPGTVAAGQTATLTVTLTNAGGSTITLDGAQPFTDDPIDGIGNAGFGLKLTAAPSLTGCGAGVATATAGNTGFRLTGGSIAAGAACVITVTYQGTTQTPGTPQAFTNTIAEGAVKTTDPTIISQLAVASVNVVDQLTVAKSVSPASGAVGAGNPIQYTITVNNFASAALTNVKVTDTLPAGMTLLTTLPAPPALSGAPCAGLSMDGASTPAVPVFVIASFGAGAGPNAAICSITFWAQTPQNAAPGLTLTNAIGPGGVTGTSPGGPVTNHGGSGNANVTVGNTLTNNKAFNPSSAFEGTVSQLTVTFTNLSAKPITATAFTDALPIGTAGAQLLVANPATASTTCVGATVTAVPGAATVSVAGATIPAKAGNGTGADGTCTLTVSVIGAAGSYVNSLPAAATHGIETYADNNTHTANSPGPISASLTYSSALTAAKSFSPTTVASGGMSTVTITLGNVGTGTLNGIGVVDPLPAGMVVAPTPAGQTTCGGAPVVSAVAGASSASLSGAVIPASGQCTLQFNVVATGAGNWINTIPIGNVSAAGGVRNVAPVTATLTNSTAGGVSVTNNASPNSLTSPGQVSVLTLTLTNGGTVDLSGLNLTDYYTLDGTVGGAQTGMINGTTPQAATTCPGGIVTASPSGTSITLTGASLAHGASCTVTLNVTLITTGTVQNKIPVGAVTNAQGISNTLATTTSLSASANVGVTKRFTPAVIRPGDRSRLQITLINPSAQALTAVSATDNLPAGLVVPAGANPTTTCTGATVSAPTPSQVSVTGGSLPGAVGGVSAICIAEIDVTAAAAGTYNNTIAVGQVTAILGGAPVSNPEPAPAPLEVRSPVAVGKAFSPNAVGLGVASTLTITLTNPNTVPLTAAALIDNLPANVTVALTPNSSTTCIGGVVTAAVSATSVRLTGGTIPASGACNVKVDVVSNVAGTYLNTIPAGALATAQGVTNETPTSDTLKIIDPPSISKQFSPTSIPSGGTSALTIVLGNPNATPATLTADLIDTLPTSPANIVVATPNGLAGTCALGSVTATAGGGTVKYASGAAIPAGGCTIVVNVTGVTNGVYTNTIPVGGLQTNQGNNVQPTNADLTISPLGFISGKVFKDNNVTPNGTFELGVDAPIAGVTLTLTGTDYGADGVAGGGDDTPINRNTTTDALGNYAFTGLNPGSYTVSEPTQPAGTTNGVTTAGSVTGGGGGTSGIATAVATTPSVIGNVILLRAGGAVASSANNNFAEIAPSSIAGAVFLDQDDNGVRNAADTAIAGVTVQLFNGATLVASTVTDGSGAYLFSGLAPGTYTVREPTQPAGTANGKTLAGTVGNGGAAGTATAQNVVPSQIAGLILPPGTASISNDFAEVPAGRQISGRVFGDANNDGVFNGADTGLGGVPLVLTGTDFNGLPVNAATNSTADGRYVFTGLAAGTYTVTEPGQPGGTSNGITTAGSTGGLATLVAVTPSAISSINLTGVNTISSNNNFAEIILPAPPPVTSSISGRVYVDTNNNGTIDAGEAGLPGVTITLTGTSSTGAPVSLSTTTLGDGSYVFSNIPASNPSGYVITETQPAAFSDGKTTLAGGGPGSGTAVKPVAAGGSDTIGGVVLTAGGVLTGYNFGELPAGASVAGFVYVDGNNNGSKDAGEAGIAGVSVRLTGTDSVGNAVDRTTTTGADGAYAFAGVAASNAAGYAITETQPSGFVDGKTTVAGGGPGAPAGAKPVSVGGADAISGVVVKPNDNLKDYDFGELRTTASVAGYVYVDANNNGLRDAGEAPIAGVTIRLTGTDTNGVAVSLIQVTDAGGAFAFNVAASGPGGYTLTEVQPAGFTDGKTTILAGEPGAAAARKPVGVGDGDTISGIVVPVGAAFTDYRFGELGVPQLKPPIVNGYVYLDRNHTRVRPTDGSEAGQAGWTVVLKQNGTTICTTTTDATGFYQFDNLHCVGYEVSGLPTGAGYSIAFSKDGNNLPNIPTSGDNRGQVPPTGGQILNITLSPADKVVEQNLPLDPAGVVYNSVTRQPVPGAMVHITGPAGFDPATQLVGGLPAVTQTVGADGLYQFLLQNNFPSGIYTLTVTAPAGFMPAPSTSLPPCANTLNVGLAVNPALIQASDFAPGGGVTPQINPATCPGLVIGGATTTQYFLTFVITNGGSAPILNNHIPLDPILGGALQVTKTTPMVTVSRGGLVPYTITATNGLTTPLAAVTLRDQLPPGFKFREGTATENGKAVVPIVTGQFVTWPTETFAPKQKNTYTLMLVVGAGVGDGDYVNHAFVAGVAGTPVSNVAAATVRITPDPTFDCPDIIGKVFDDKNANGYQDDGEPGIPGVRMATPNGLLITSDADGRFHVPCPVLPNADRGSNFVMKLDERSLPSGFRLTTENPRDVRVTRGKLTKLNFGATVHRVIRIELNGEAFTAGGTDLLPAWKTQIDALPARLAERPSVVRIAYAQGQDGPTLAGRRAEAVRRLIDHAWKAAKGRYTLVVEIEAARP
ncbi:SdrD B-like domain-containing protein [Phenylobacterium sp.]|uniref:DUF7933 domain-containing protein n=1 Tax=Phenylobacterium sp. TaxID=1871053 RepID=UPI00374DB3C6